MARSGKPGEYTTFLGKRLAQKMSRPGPEGRRVYWDPDLEGGHLMVAYFGRYSRATTVSHPDIAVVNPETKKCLLLCEIEESRVNPKVVLGDVCSLYMAEKVRIRGVDYDFTDATFIVGVVASSSGRFSEKLANLTGRAPQMVKDAWQRGIVIVGICRPTAEELIQAVEAAAEGVFARVVDPAG